MSAHPDLEPVSTGDALSELKRLAAENRPEFGTGWSVDESCGLVSVGELALLWARSGSGKSSVMLNMIRNSPDVPTAVFNMEMTAHRQFEWLATMTYDLSASAKEVSELLKWGEDDDRYGELVEALDRTAQRYPNLHFFQPNRPSVTDLRIMVDDIEMRTGVRPQRVFIDHVTLLEGAFDYQGVSATTSALHDWAMKDQLAVYALQQTGRSGGDRQRDDGGYPLGLGSGVFSGEADADWIYGLYRPEKNPYFKKTRDQFKKQENYWKMLQRREELRGVSVLQVIKNRPYGLIDEDGVRLRYDPHTRRFRDVGRHTRE